MLNKFNKSVISNDDANAAVGVLALFVLIVDAMLGWITWSVFGALIASTTLGAVVGFGIAAFLLSGLTIGILWVFLGLLGLALASLD